MDRRGTIGAVKEEPPRIEIAVRKYLDDARAQHLAEATITKLTTIFEKQFLAWTQDRGLRYLRELTPERLTAWRSTWKDEALADVNGSTTAIAQTDGTIRVMGVRALRVERGGIRRARRSPPK